MPTAAAGPARLFRNLLWIFVCVVLFSSHILGQTDYQLQLGLPPNGAVIPVELGFINLTNGNLRIPAEGDHHSWVIPITIPV